MKNIVKKIATYVCLLFITTTLLPGKVAYAAGENENPRVMIADYELEGPVVFGEETILHLNVKNMSKNLDVTEVLITYSSSNGAFSPAVGDVNQIYIERINKNAAVSVDVPVVIYGQGKEFVQASFRIQYTVENKGAMENTNTIFFPLDKTDAEIPRVILKNYSIDEVTPGKETMLHLTFANISDVAEATEILVTYASSNSTIFPVVGASNQFTVPTLAPGAEAVIDLPVMIYQSKDDYAFATFNIQYFMNEEYAKSNNSNIVVSFDTNSNFEINNLYLAKTAVVGSKTLIGVSYRNNDNSPITKIVMHVSGIDGKSQQFNLGSLEEKQSLYAENYIVFENSGTQNISISFTYEDENGNTLSTKTTEHEITVSKKSSSVTTNPSIGGDATDVTTDNTSVANPYATVLICGVVAIAVIFILVFILKKK